MLDTGKPIPYDGHLCGWENAQKILEQSGGKQNVTEFSQGPARSLRTQTSCSPENKLKQDS